MHKRMLSVSRKLAILEEPEQSESIEITARKHKLQKIQITNWSVGKEKLIEKPKIFLYLMELLKQ